jgi:hypothetical protein
MGFYVPEVAPEEEGGTAAIGGGGLGAFVTSELQVRACKLKYYSVQRHMPWR